MNRKEKLIAGAVILLLLSGITLLLYPIVSNKLYDSRKSGVVENQDTAVKAASETTLERERRLAREYNATLLQAGVIVTDPFDPSAIITPDSEPYASLCNLNGDGVMGTVEVPKLDINLPIYHGTAGDTLQEGIGHIENTSLPVGGESTHTVLTSHTGLPGKKLFTDLVDLKEGDVFYLHVLGETLAYQVDSIQIVEPENTEPLRIVHGEDHATLLTCYPYGVNSHRLMVRGTRVPYEAAAEVSQEKEAMGQWEREYLKALGTCLAVYLPLLLLLMIVLWRRKKKREKTHTDNNHFKN